MPSLLQMRKHTASPKEESSPLTRLFIYLALTVPLNANNCAVCWVGMLRKRERLCSHKLRLKEGQIINKPTNRCSEVSHIQLPLNHLFGSTCIPPSLCKHPS